MQTTKINRLITTTDMAITGMVILFIISMISINEFAILTVSTIVILLSLRNYMKARAILINQFPR
jgi:hypothetical protein